MPSIKWMFVRTLNKESQKPLLVLLYGESLLRLWLEKTLRPHYRLHVFSSIELALNYLRSVKSLDILVTDLELDSVLGGCNIVREANQLFPKCQFFIFGEASGTDHRLRLLRALKNVQFISRPFGVFFLTSRIHKILSTRNSKEI